MRIFKRKGSPHWWYDFSVRGRRFRASTGADARDVADQIASKLRTDELLRVTTGKRPSLSLDEAFGQWWLQVGQHHRAHRRSEGIGKTILKLFGKATLLEEIDDAAIAQAVARRRGDVADATVNREIAVLRAVLNAARRKWKVATAEVDWAIHKLAEPEARDRYLTPAEADALLAAAADHMRPIIVCALCTGLRRSNVLALDWSQIDLSDRPARITVFGKSRRPGGKKLVIPVATPLLAVLAKLGPRERGPVFAYVAPRRRNGVQPAPRMVADVKTGFRAACGRAGLLRWVPDEGKHGRALIRAHGPCTPVRWVPSLRFHDLRHTAASWMVQNGVPLDVVQRILGHSDIKLTQRYAHRAPDAPAKAVEVIGYHWGAGGTKLAQLPVASAASD
jgi:integrase